MRTKNVVTVRFLQDLSYVTNSRMKDDVEVPGKLVQFSNDAEFSSETLRDISAENVAAFAIAKVEHFIAMSRLQGKQGFKLNKPIVFSLKVNNSKAETFELKMSLSIPRLQKTLERSPEAIARAFSHFENVADSTVKGTIEYINRMRTGKLVIAKAVPKQLENSVETESAPVNIED